MYVSSHSRRNRQIQLQQNVAWADPTGGSASQGQPPQITERREVIRSRDIASCSVEEIVDELGPQGVTAAVNIHVRDGDSKRRTNTVILTFASPQLPKHITAGYMRVPVDPYIPNPLRCSTVKNTVTVLERAKTLLHA